MAEELPFTLTHVIDLIDAAIDLIGRTWVEKAIARELSHRKRDRPLRGWMRWTRSRNRKPPHPAVMLILAARDWQAAQTKTDRINWAPEPAYLAGIGELVSVRTLPGFSRIEKDFRDPQKFEGAVFECQVALAHSQGGDAVEFVEEGDSKLPDLKIVRKSGEHFWIECKSQRKDSDRDISVDRFWDSFITEICGHLDSTGRNYAIAVRALAEPVQSQAARLSSEIASLLDSVFPYRFIKSADIPATRDSTGNFEVSARFLSEPNAIQSGTFQSIYRRRPIPE